MAHHFREAEGLSIAQIAERLGRSPATIKAYFYDPTGSGPSSGSGEAFEVLTDVDGSIVVRLTGELEFSTVSELEAVVGRLLGGGGGRLVIDARDLQFAEDLSGVARTDLQDKPGR